MRLFTPAIALAVLAGSGSCTCTKSAATAAKAKVVLVVMDGFGLAPASPGNAVSQALAARPTGLLARALVAHAYPTTTLGASGECVGLSAGREGNSEAGHNNICASDVVEQHRTYLTRLRESGGLSTAPGLLALLERVHASGRPLHVVVTLADQSSSGHYADVLEIIRLAAEHGVADLQLHGLCSGRSTTGCREMTRQIQAALGAHGGFATIAGVDHCFSRVGPTPEIRECVAVMRAPRTGQEATLDELLGDGAAGNERAAGLAPHALRGSPALGADDEILLLQYRRDMAVGMVRELRGRVGESDPPRPFGPRVVTLTPLDRRSRYDDDPFLAMALPRSSPGGFLHEQLAAAGLRELRIAEEDKAAHVTYFCDEDDVPDGPTYARFHPPAVPGDLTLSPCLKSREAVVRATQALTNNEADFILMNLPNADLLGHTGDVAAATKGIECMDESLELLAAATGKAGAWLLITADHGNAEGIVVDGVAKRGHTVNPVPFIVVPPPGAGEVRVRQAEPRECLHAVSWTVLDLFGVSPHPGNGLIPR